MHIISKIIIRASIVLALLLAGFAAGFPVGHNVGFTMGSEWALVQAEILARHAGVPMSDVFEGGSFRAVVRQPPDLHRRAWQLADRHDEEVKRLNKDDGGTLSKTARVTQGTYLTH